MTTEFKVSGHYANDPIMEYRYTGDEKLLRMVTYLPDDFQTNNIKREHDFIVEWSNFTKSAFDVDPAESDKPCWEGHYEQFGRVMLQVLYLCNSRATHEGQLKTFVDSVFTDREDFASYLCEITGSEERVWYRAWFSLLGHPDYQGFELASTIHAQNFMHKKFMLSFASYELYEVLKKAS